MCLCVCVVGLYSHDKSWPRGGSQCIVCLYVQYYQSHTDTRYIGKCIVCMYGVSLCHLPVCALCIVCVYVRYYQVAYRHTICGQIHRVHVWCVFVSFACVCPMYCVCVCAILPSRIETHDMWTNTSCACMVCHCIICMYRVYASCLCVSCVCMCPIYHVSVCAIWQVAYRHTKHRTLMICIVCMCRVSSYYVSEFVCALYISCLYVE